MAVSDSNKAIVLISFDRPEGSGDALLQTFHRMIEVVKTELGEMAENGTVQVAINESADAILAKFKELEDR